MNNLTRFKLKTLTALTICFFTTFSMLVYVARLTEKCENSEDGTCVRAIKNPVHVFRKSGERTPEAPAEQMAKPEISSSGPEAQFRKREEDGTPVDTSGGPEKVPPKALPEWGEEQVEGPKVGTQRATNSARRRDDRASPTWNSRLETYENRRRNLRRLCLKYFDPNRVGGSGKKIKLNHVLIDEKHKILYCYVPKVACTNWKRIFLLLTGKAENVTEVIRLPASRIHAKNLFETLQNYTMAEAIELTRKYTKFVFVRHPFERLLSAYRNKLEQHYDSSKYFQARFGKYIVRNFRKNPTNSSLARGDDVTFAEFADYIVSSDPDQYNEHWQRVTDLCHPCLIEYDFVGKYESLIEDSNFLLRLFGKDFRFPVLAKPSTTSSNLKRYYDTLGKSTILKLYRIYEMDFRLFGYDLFDSRDWFRQS